MAEDKSSIQPRPDSTPEMTTRMYSREVVEDALKSASLASRALYDASGYFKSGGAGMGNFRTSEQSRKERELLSRIDKLANDLVEDGALAFADFYSAAEPEEKVLFELDGEVGRIVFEALTTGNVARIGVANLAFRELHPVKENGQIRRYSAKSRDEMIPNLFVDTNDPELEDPSEFTRITTPIKLVIAR